MSKATLVLQEGKLFRKAIFFSLLNPQVSGAGFAGIRTEANLDLQQYGSLAMRVRGQGQNKKYKFILRHKGESKKPQPAYVYLFEVRWYLQAVKPFLLKNNKIKAKVM